MNKTPHDMTYQERLAKLQARYLGAYKGRIRRDLNRLNRAPKCIKPGTEQARVYLEGRW
jgi:hypothetical protein